MSFSNPFNTSGSNGYTSETLAEGTKAATNGHTPACKIKLYTNHGCPYAHRAHITLEELKLPYEEVLIDLSVPREQWYLDINPRGLVPAIEYTVDGIYDKEVVTESAIVSQFLADSYPSHLLPATREDPKAPLKRARINYFIDTWNSKISSHFFGVLTASDASEKEKLTGQWAAAVEKELEPLLKDANPFFGGSSELTFAEVIAAPFIMRWSALSRDGEVVPKTFWERLNKLEHFSKWAAALHKRDSVLKIWNEKKIVAHSKVILEKRRQAGKAAH